MHELSIAIRIVESLEAELADRPEYVVEQVNLEVGTLTGLVPEALEFCWEVATEESRLKGSWLNIEVVPAGGLCTPCGVEREIANLQSFRCPVCGSPISQITAGNQIEIRTLEVQDGG